MIMGATNTTPNLDLPQFVDGDKPNAEFGRLQGIIDNLQTQINNKVDK